MLYIAPTSGNEPLINISGSSIDFNVVFSDSLADITAVGYLVDVSMSGTMARVRWYLPTYPSTEAYYTYWDSQEGIPVTGASIRQVGSYNGGCSLAPVGFNPVNDPVGVGGTWYTGSTTNGNFFLGFTFICPFSGYYSIFADTMYLGSNTDRVLFNINYEATVTVSIAGQSSMSTDSYSGAIDQKMTTHTGLNVPSVLLMSGSSYIFNFDVDINISSITPSPPAGAVWTLWLGDPDNFPTRWYRVTGTAG